MFKKQPQFVPFKKLNKTKVKKQIFWVLQFNTRENTQHMRRKRDQQRCKAKLFQFLTQTHLSLCPYSSEKLCDCSSTRTMTEAMQGQREEETCCSGRYKASQICYSQGKERYYTGVRKKPQNKVCLERYKHSNHKKPHQLLLAAINHYKHLSNSLFTAAVSGECLFFQFLLFIAPRKKKKKNQQK